MRTPPGAAVGRGVHEQWSFDQAAVPLRLTHMWRRRGDRVVVVSDAHFNLRRVELNQIGSRIWELMDGRRTVTQIIDHVAQENPFVPRERIEAGAMTFLDDLRSDWLIMSREELETYE